MSRHSIIADGAWKDVVEFEGVYAISTHGRVKRYASVVIVPSGPREGVRMHFPERVLKGKLIGGYLHVVLCGLDGSRRRVAVHRLVLETFVGLCPEGMLCCHRDDVPTNNHLTNLRWDTPKGNYDDRVRLNHANDVTVLRGEKCNQAKLTEDAVRDIRRERSKGVPIRVLMSRYRVSAMAVSKATNKKTWKHVN